MSNLKTFIVIALIAFVSHGPGAVACGTSGRGVVVNSNANTNAVSREAEQSKVKQKPSPSPTPAQDGGEKVMDGQAQELKVLAQGAHGKMSEPFLVVARDAEVYAALRRMTDGLPEVAADFFRSNAVVAAFLGTRNTGGYAVRISRGEQGRIVVAEQSPPKDAFVTQVLTQPFQVVSVPVRDEDAVEVQLQGKFESSLMRPYRLKSGEFQSGGGFAGRMENFKLEGGFGVARFNNLATVLFDLRGTATQQPRVLKSAATGLVNDDGRLRIASMDAGTLVSKPRSPLSVAGQFTGDGAQVSLSFTSLPPRLADGFGGSGQLEAAANGPAPPKRNGDETYK